MQDCQNTTAAQRLGALEPGFQRNAAKDGKVRIRAFFFRSRRFRFFRPCFSSFGFTFTSAKVRKKRGRPPLKMLFFLISSLFGQW
jgi:hypothetical protein